MQALPKDAPSMINPDPKAVATVALVTVRMKTDGDVTLEGHARAVFTLPKEQIGGRGFAVQLFHESIGKKNKRDDRFFGTFNDSKLSGNSLTFEMDLPKLPVKKDETWMLVLYGDELPTSSSSPSANPSASASASPSASASASPSANPSPT